MFEGTRGLDCKGSSCCLTCARKARPVDFDSHIAIDWYGRASKLIGSSAYLEASAVFEAMLSLHPVAFSSLPTHLPTLRNPLVHKAH